MRPPNERRPGMATEAATIHAGSGIVEDSESQAADEMPRFEPKSGGIVRVNRTRTIEARCVDCDLFVASTGPAASHARRARHRVDVDYRTVFTYAPAELLDRSR